MKILGRIKKSKVLTAVMTAVLIFQSACPTGLAYAAQKSGVSAYAAGQTIDQALGATKTVESVLSQHENDEYYLTTPYGNKGPHGEGGAIDTWDCWKPKASTVAVLYELHRFCGCRPPCLRSEHIHHRKLYRQGRLQQGQRDERI